MDVCVTRIHYSGGASASAAMARNVLVGRRVGTSVGRLVHI